MEINTTAGIASGSSSSAASSGASLAQDFDTFLTLLTSQLQNQDPLDPMESNEMTQQLVAFAGVEQQIVANKNLENISSLLLVNAINASTSYLGKTALLQADTIENTGTGGKWQYELETDAYNVKLEVVDEDGFTVYSTTGNGATGIQDFEWDGKDMTGNVAPEGNYTLKVTASDEQATAIRSLIYSEHKITGVDTSTSTPWFAAGPYAVTQSEILRLSIDS
ncbi:flagellar hook assembly protein FlgD [Gimibacter soli]|uniref:Basal-body rod modification protein FlgD n=1 Tax=Gimibacter soli TaxID=3024400 RepID=A0AAF0BN19_9PROT|nr:flagellar hook capping FlgD N-terminal domain-containing protein [Gimibacter soli]WCL55395.1 flagellar hook capping FlgD N-terminal domain-containing protein [Gimibacter soli]